MGVELLFGGLIKLLASSGFGTVFGGIMGFFNRKADLDYKKLEYEDKRAQRDHELKLREADAALMKLEAESKLAVAQVEAEATVQAEGFKAMSASYDYARPEPGSKMGAFSSFVRPFVSLSYFFLTALVSIWVLYRAFQATELNLPPETWYALVLQTVDWLFFMASATIGWWFAMRPGKAPGAK